MAPRYRFFAAALLIVLAPAAPAQRNGDPQLTPQRIFASREFAPDFLGETRWLDDGG